jgi:hypothetical protein
VDNAQRQMKLKRCRARRRLGISTFVVAALVGPIFAAANEPHVELEVLSDTGFRSSEPVYQSINSQNELAAFWTLHGYESNKHPIPTIDLQSHTLLVASSGTKPNGGYSIALVSVRESSSSIAVSVLDAQPDRICPTTQELAHPQVLALIPKSMKPVTFTVSIATVKCNSRKMFR